MTKLAEDLDLNSYKDYLNIGTLKELLYSLPAKYSDCKVMVERVEDIYYEKNGWETLKIKSVEYPECIEEYSPVWCASLDKDNNILRLFMHY